MKKYGTICECGNTKDTFNNSCTECEAIEENNKLGHTRTMTCWTKDKEVRGVKGLSLRGKANAPVWN